MIRSNWLYIAVMFAVSYTIRILPLTLMVPWLPLAPSVIAVSLAGLILGWVQIALIALAIVFVFLFLGGLAFLAAGAH